MLKRKKVISIVMNNFKQDFRVLKEATSLCEAGYEVKILALHDGYSDLPEYENIGRIIVERILLCSKNWSKNKFTLGIKYLEYMFKVVYKSKNADIIHCNDIEPLFISMFIKFISFGKIKIVYDAHELEYDKNGLSTFGRIIIEFQERIFLKFVDAFITVSESIANDYRNKYNITDVSLVLNCPPSQSMQKSNIFREKFKLGSDITVFLYQGRLTKGRGIEQILEAFIKLNRNDMVIIFIGEGGLQDYLNNIADKERNIYIHEAVPPNLLYQYTKSADIGLCCIENVCKSYYYCLPNKLFEYIQAGLPVICSDYPELRRIVKENNLGIVMKEYGVNGMVQAIEEMMNYKKNEFSNFKANIEKVSQKYCWEEQEKELLRAYDKVVNNEFITY